MSSFFRRSFQRTMRAGVLLAPVFLAWAAPAAAETIGSQGFADFGLAGVNTNDVNDATTFTIGDLSSTDESAGYFVGLPEQIFGAVTFTITNPTSLTFGTPEFGSFASTSIQELSNDPLVGSRSFLVQGSYTKGTFGGPLSPNPAPATFTVSFNQTAGAGTAISNNSTLAVVAVPEPATWVLATAAVAIGGLVRARRRG